MRKHVLNGPGILKWLDVHPDDRKEIVPRYCCLDIEEDMFNLGSDSGYPEVFMRPQESLNIPFKYQSFKTTYEQDSSNPLGTKIKDVTRRVASDGQLPRSIKVNYPSVLTLYLTCLLYSWPANLQQCCRNINYPRPDKVEIIHFLVLSSPPKAMLGAILGVAIHSCNSKDTSTQVTSYKKLQFWSNWRKIFPGFGKNTIGITSTS